jgi:phosphodiesterase/alkaline phosphatase D-like protein
MNMSERVSSVTRNGLLGIALCATAFSGGSAWAQCGSPPNAIVAENCLTGNPPAQWNISGAGDPTLQGFATDISVNVGQVINFKISTDATSYTIGIYRLGYYAGLGARNVATVIPSATLPQTQPACLTDTATRLVDCGNWAVSASWTVPANAVSGMYVALLKRADTSGVSQIVFVVRNDASTAAMLYQASDTTWQAYNNYGGYSLYLGSPPAYKVSYNRPNIVRGTNSLTSPFDSEYPMIRWLEANGYDLSYSTGVDSVRNGSLIINHKVFLSVGHDEYWAGPQRSNVEAAQAAGVHLAFFSGNEIFWKTRWENSIDGSNTPYRTLVCYKETSANAKIDPTTTWTGTWRDPRFSPPSDGGRPENALSGTIFQVNGPEIRSILVPAADGKMRFWRNTTIATQAPGDVATLPSGTLGFEWDIDSDNGFRPAGLIHLSSATYAPNGHYLIDYGTNYGNGTATHSMTEYRASSGSRVFAAGTVRWSWGLDSTHDNDVVATDVRMQQATVNVLADMGAQPGSIQPGLVLATASTDTTPPTSVIASPTTGSSATVGTPLTISGTATDLGGGVIGGVEVSTDGGSTWHPATGRESWSYPWTPLAAGTVSVQVRATDDSLNIQTSPTIILVNVSASGVSIFGTVTPADGGDLNATELGLKFRSDQAGVVTGVRFYKLPFNSGTHIGNLWNSTGTLLATATFVAETNSGWQQANFSTPVAIAANTTYIVSYFAPNGHYAFAPNYFVSGVDTPPLHALANGVDGPNGVFLYSATSGFPSSNGAGANYYVDLAFAPPPVISALTAIPGASGTATITWTTTLPANSRVDYGTAPASLTLNISNPALVTAHSLSLSGLTQGTTYYYRVTSVDAFTNTSSLPVAPATATFIESSFSVWAPTVTPARVDGGDPAAVELGLKFRSDLTGAVTGVRFYKAATNTGTHVGHLWTSTGTLLGTVTFTGETASGWQQASFATPISIAANTTYIVSYLAPNGHYSYNPNFFTTAGVDNPPLHALAFGVDGPNAVYLYGAAGGFPSTNGNSANYWVDLTFVDIVPPVISAVAAAPTPTTATITWTTNEASNSRVDYGTSPGALTQNATNASLVTAHSLTLTALTTGTVYYYRVTSADASGNSSTSPVATSAPATFTPSDATPPVISAVTAVPGTTTASITWTTDENSTSRVDYGTSPSSLTLNASSATLVTGHSINLSGLTIGTVYYFRVTSVDGAGNSATSPVTTGAPATFTTINPNPPVITMVTAIPGISGVATITWMTDKLSTSRVDYGTSAASLTLNVSNAALVTSHSLNLSGLTQGTTYFFRVTSVDSASNTSSSPVAPAAATFIENAISVWAPTVTPGRVDGGDPVAVELGLKFRSDVNGVVTGVRFYKATTNIGTHVGHLWTSTGTLLGTVTFAGETASGWQQATFATPIAIVANTTYIVSYLAPSGHYSYNPNFFTTAGVDTPPLHALANGVDGPNAVYLYGAAGGFPTTNGNTANYWVDLSFAQSLPPVITTVAATPGINGTATVTWTTSLPANSRVDYGTSSGSLTLNVSDPTQVTSHSLSLSGLTQGTTYFYRVTSVDPFNNSTSSPVAPATASFVENAVSVWAPSVTPVSVDGGDTNSVEVGLKFRSDLAGIVTGVRFYKAAANTGTHIGNLWTGTGTLLGSVTFTGETASGWQQANFATPVSIAANTTYIVSYFAPIGHYSINTGFFNAGGVDTPPLHALAGGLDGPNGVFLYSAASGFPTTNGLGANYWVDLTFSDNVPPAISAVAAVPATTTATITWTTDEPSNSRVDFGTSPSSLTQNATNASIVTAHSITLTGLTATTVYYYRVTSADGSGNSSTSPVTTGAPATFTTTSPAGPVITAVTAVPGTTTAAITWTTDTNSTSRVDYGTSPSSLTLNSSSATLVTSHSINLTALTAATVYYYRVTSVDGSNNSTTSPVTTSAPATFTTIDPNPPVITLVTAIPGLAGTATVTWTTNKLATSRVDYGTSSGSLTLNVSNPALVTSHSLNLSGLTQGTTYFFRVTSVDSSSNSSSSPVAPATATFLENAASVWAPSVTPGGVDGGDPNAVELGMKFRSDSAGIVTGVRFYKAATNIGTHIGHLWSSTGTSLGSVTFTGETASGWQQATFATPVAIAANTTYIVSYLAPSGHYSYNGNFFTTAGVDNPPLHALANGVDGPNSVYLYGASGGFPITNGNSANYWVDLTFVSSSGPAITAVTAVPGATTATITWTTDTNSTSSVDYGTSPGSLTLNASSAALVTGHTINLTGLTGVTTYYFRVTSVDGSGNSSTSPVTTSAPASFATVDSNPPVITLVTATPGIAGTATITWTTNKLATSRIDYGTSSGSLTLNVSDPTLVTSHSLNLSGLTQGTTYFYRVTSVDSLNNSASSPVAPATASFLENAVSVWAPTVIPSVLDPGDPGAVELGLKFRSDTAGMVIGVRFYKAATNTGTHVGHLWSSTGTLMGTVTFTGETASGWQQANFATPIAIVANTTYVVSYFAPSGHYSYNSGYFATAGADNAPLHALANGVDGSNAVYVYGASGGFPNTGYGANYWVDLVFH